MKEIADLKHVPYEEMPRDYALHLMGEIQDVGYTIAVRCIEPTNIRIVAVSDNIVKAKWSKGLKSPRSSVERPEQSITIDYPEDFLEQNIFDVFNVQTALSISKLISKFQLLNLDPASGTPPVRNFTQIKMMSFNSTIEIDSLQSCSISVSKDNIFILEFEDLDSDDHNPFDIQPIDVLRSGDVVGRIRTSETPVNCTAVFCDTVMEIIKGIDRGLVYKFGDDESGEVIYEVCI
jgi:light-regulated signal transduction histidine kinase (bacteriophytochrome)